MDQQSFRFYIPGIIFLIPVFAIACWITVNTSSDSDIRLFVLVGGITVFPALALPVGWLIFHSYTVLRLYWTGGRYEDKDFVKLVKKDTKPFYLPSSNSILIDFSHIDGVDNWLKIEPDIFRKIFYPRTTFKKFYSEIKAKGFDTQYNEQYADLVTMKYIGRDYLKSISSIRYGLESGLFALLLGILYTVSIDIIWRFENGQNNQLIYFVTGVFLLSVLTIIFIITLIIRWKQADREYDARLILHVVSTNKSHHFKIDTLCLDIPKEIIEKLNILPVEQHSYAAFDLDNTLLIGDIGHAVFATLINKNIVKNFTWKEYIEMREVGIEAALKKIIEVMNGIELETLKTITENIIESKDEFIEVEGVKMRTPKPNSVMASIISLLKTKGIDVYVVTASNKISADIICWKFFGIPSSNVLGAESKIKNGKIQFKSETMIPFAEGKVKTLKKKFKEQPIITGGDGIWDKYLLDYTNKKGIRLWLGNDETEYQKLKENYYKESDFFKIQF